MVVPRLFARVDQRIFREGDEARLSDALHQCDAQTIVDPPHSPKDVQLRMDGTTVACRQRYTSLSFHQTAQALGSGLGRLVTNLSGINPRSSFPGEDFDFRTAVGVFNRVADVRFASTLADRRMVIHHDDQRIDGLLGPQTRYLENCMLLELVADSVRGLQRPCSFHLAVLAGRRLLLRYLHEAPLFAIETHRGVDEYYQGYHFSNSEAGDASVRAAVIFYRSETGACCMTQFAGHKGRMLHVGRMQERLQNMLANVLGRENSSERLQAQLLRLQDIPLYHRQEEDRTRLHKRISRAFQDEGVSASIADRIIHRAMCRPQRGAEAVPTLDKRSTFYDLFNATTSVAAELNVARRELVEQAAYRLLTGDLTV